MDLIFVKASERSSIEFKTGPGFTAISTAKSNSKLIDFEICFETHSERQATQFRERSEMKIEKNSSILSTIVGSVGVIGAIIYDRWNNVT